MEALEYRLLRPDGTIVIMETSGAPVLDEQGNLLGYRGTNMDITERKRAEEEHERLIAELGEALGKVRTLSGLLPICANCKKIRDDKGYWNQIECYIQDRSEA